MRNTITQFCVGISSAYSQLVFFFFIIYFFLNSLTLVALQGEARRCEHKGPTVLRRVRESKGLSLTGEQRLYNARAARLGRMEGAGPARSRQTPGELTSSFSQPPAGAAGIICRVSRTCRTGNAPEDQWPPMSLWEF